MNEDKSSEVLPMEISESLRSDNMEIEESSQISKRKTSTEIPSDKIELSELSKIFNEMEIIETIFQVKLRFENTTISDNSIFTIQVDPTFLNCMLFQTY